MYGNERGFTLVEVLIATACVAGLSLVVMNLYKQGIKNSADLDNRQELRDLRDQFNMAIKSGSCGLIDSNLDFKTAPKISLNTNSSNPKILKSLFSLNHEFKASHNIGHFKIMDTNPFSIVPAPETSPMLVDCDKKGGAYCVVEKDVYAVDIVIALKKPNITGAGQLNLKFMALVKLDASKNISECNSINEISSAKENCEAMESDVADYNWNDDTLTCEVVAKDEGAASDGTLSLDDQGDIDKKYIY